MKTRARKNSVIFATNTLGGKAIDMTSLADGMGVIWDELNNRYMHVELAAGNHDHEIGNMVLIFENGLI